VAEATVRRALIKRFLSRVRRKRCFEVSLVEPMTAAYSFEHDVFRDFHRGTLRPWLKNVTRCLVFREDYSRASDWDREISARREAAWARAGARTAEWRASYIKRDAAGEQLMLTPQVVDDELFWWWALTQTPGMELLFLVPFADFDWVGFFQRTCDPRSFGGSRPAVLRDAKQETRRNGMVAFRISNSLTASVVGSAPNVEQLFQLAVEHAMLTSRMVAPRSTSR
jgi:hypothetical protein